MHLRMHLITPVLLAVPDKAIESLALFANHSEERF